MNDRPDPRLQDESRLDAIKRAVEDVAQDAPTPVSYTHLRAHET